MSNLCWYEWHCLRLPTLCSAQPPVSDSQCFRFDIKVSNLILIRSLKKKYIALDHMSYCFNSCCSFINPALNGEPSANIADHVQKTRKEISSQVEVLKTPDRLKWSLHRAMSVVWTNPLVATLGMSLTIPLAMLADMVVHGRHYSFVYILGSAQVFLTRMVLIFFPIMFCQGFSIRSSKNLGFCIQNL